MGRVAARQKLQKQRGPRTWAGPVALAVYSAALAFLFWQAIHRPEWVSTYLAVRWVALGLPWLLVTVAALQEGLLPGLGCLFLPGYVVLYSLRRVEYAWMRYLILGALALLAAEYVWWHDQSVVVWVSAQTDAFNNRVMLLLKRAGDPEYF